MFLSQSCESRVSVGTCAMHVSPLHTHAALWASVQTMNCCTCMNHL